MGCKTLTHVDQSNGVRPTGTITREGAARELLADDAIRAAYLGVA